MCLLIISHSPLNLTLPSKPIRAPSYFSCLKMTSGFMTRRAVADFCHSVFEQRMRGSETEKTKYSTAMIGCHSESFSSCRFARKQWLMIIAGSFSLNLN